MGRNNFSEISTIGEDIVALLLKVCLWDLKNCTLRFQRNNLSESFFRVFWNLYRTLGGICVGFLVRTFREGCHNCFLRVQMNIWRKKFWAKVFFIFVWHWEKKVLAFRQKCFEVVVNIAFYVSRGSSSKFFVLVKKVVLAIEFGQWAKKVGAITKKFSAEES